jgi:2,3-bisphosphoglycerate-independent phosphoglycerate mutase
MTKTVLCIIDGLGVAEPGPGNAVTQADMKNLQAAMSKNPTMFLRASGLEVGLADEKDPGNSEVGHNAIGSGQYIKQGLSLLNEAFITGGVYKTATWKSLVTNAKKSKLNDETFECK